MKTFVNGREVQLVVAALLLGALVNLPYGYYTFLRWVVCLGSAYCGWQAKQTGRVWWAIGFCGLAILFNPFKPVYLHRDLWTWIDTVAAIVFLAFSPTPRKEIAE